MSTATAQLYETDFYGWIQNQVGILRARNLADLDVDNLIEEIESMGKSQKRALTSRLEVLFMHLLKWQFQPALKGPRWRFTIEEQRVRIVEHLDENPSLKSAIPACVEVAYRHAKRLAARKTGIDETQFPVQCPWTFEQTLNPDFWPET